MDSKIKASLQYSTKEGIMAQVMIIITDYYVIPFALYLKATPPEIGLLVAVPHLSAAIIQIFSVNAVKFWGSRLKFIKAGVLVQAVGLIPMGALTLFPLQNKIICLIALMTIFRVMGALVGPPWGSLISDHLKQNERGEYFGNRSKAMGLAGVAGIVFWGVFLYVLKKIDSGLGFFVLFGAAAAFRFISLYYLNKLIDMPLIQRKEDDFTLWMFLKRFKESNFVKFVLFVSAITFATHISAPYFSVYMLQDLKFNYLNYMGVHLAALVAGLFSFPLWGRHADLVGNAKILKITGILIPIIPFLWILTENVALLIIIELFSGFVWGGFNLCVLNFIYDASVPEKRVRVISYFNLFNGLAVFLGAYCGGFLADTLPLIWGHKIYGVFLISGILRLMASLILSSGFKEVRQSTPPVSSKDLFYSVVGIRPLIGRTTDFNNFPPTKTI